MQTKEIRLDIGGRWLAGIDFGGDPAAELVIAVHGWLDNAASFQWLAPRLENRRVLALDLAGHGHSDWRGPGGGYAIWDYVLDLDAVLTALNEERVHLLGHSLGAAVVSLLAAVRPQRVASLVMLEGLGPLTQTPELSPDQLLKALEWHSAPPQFRCYPDRERMARARARGRFPVALEAARLLVERGSEAVDEGYVWRHDPRLLAPSAVRLSEAQVAAFLQRIQSPSLVCLTADGISTPSARARLELMSDVTIVDLAGGHHPQLEPERLDSLAVTLNDFYAELKGQAVAEEVRV